MKKIVYILVFTAISLFIGCSEDTVDLVGTGTITGRVVEADSFDPIENAKVTLSPTSNTVFTDEDGYFIFEEVEEGDYSVGAIKEDYITNYEAATVTADLEVNVIFEMEDETSLNRPPTAAELVSPEDGSEDQEISVTLIWQSSDPDEDEITYSIQIKNDYDNEVIEVESLTDTTYVVSDLKYGTKYFWQVTATDDINSEVLSEVSSFKVKVQPNNRFFYVEKYSENNNNVIYSASYSETDSIAENEVQLTSEELNSWRPRKNQASNLIAFLRTYNNQTHLFTMEEDGSDVSQVTSAVPITGVNLSDIDYAWSSNGDRLIYPHYNKLYVINKDGSGLQQIYQTTDGSYITECDWSDDESIIVLKTNDVTGYSSSIFTIDTSGNLLTTIVSNSLGALGGLNISINNKLLLYTYDITDYQNTNNRQLDTHIYLYDFSAGTSTDISSSKDNGTIDLDPRFSPDEADVIFVNTSNDGISTSYIYKMDISDNTDRTLLFSDKIMPDWE